MALLRMILCICCQLQSYDNLKLLGVPPSVSFVMNMSNVLSNCHGDKVIQSLESYVFPLLRLAPFCIHNLHFKTKIAAEYYTEHDVQKLQDVGGNKRKQLYTLN